MRRLTDRNEGFTLVELAVTLAIVAILAVVAIPSYRDYVRRGALEEASTALAAYAQRMESGYDSSGNYGVANCAVALPAANARWTYTCALQAGGQGFLATATGAGLANGFAYTLDNFGSRRTTSWAGAAVAKTCFVSRGTEC